MAKLREKIIHNVETVGGNYFLDHKSKIILPNKTLTEGNLILMFLAYGLKKNVLLMGEPGGGKTTASAITGAISTGLPMDLFRSLLLPGHPDQTEEKMTARPDFGALMSEEERVVWQKAVFFPLFQLDEFNRLPEGKQSELLDAIATGRFTYLNQNYFSGPKSFFATVNYHDGGNHEITPAGRDRFHLGLEFGFQGAVYRKMLRQFSTQAKEKLSDPITTHEILDALQNKQLSVKEKLEYIEKKKEETSKAFSKRTGLEIITADEFSQIEAEIEVIKFEQEADIYLNCIVSELNSTSKHGIKRSCDPVDNSTHGSKLASSKSHNAFSERGYNESIESFAQALCWYLNKEKVTKEHIDAIAPFCMGHRLKFTDDYRRAHANKEWEDNLEAHLSAKLLEDVAKNFRSYKNVLIAYEKFIELANKKLDPKKEKSLAPHMDAIRSMASDPKNVDYPLLREYAEFVKENHSSWL